MVFVPFTTTEPAGVGRVPSRTPAAASSRTLDENMAESAQVLQGQLWETLAPSVRGRAITTLPVAAAAFHEAQTRPVGSKIRMVLSAQCPVLAAEVTGRNVTDDGTILTHLQIHGKTSGTLTLQENKARQFFLGQLYYDGLAVAYEFSVTEAGLIATRHALSDMLCAVVNAKGGGIESLGLPALDKGKGQIAEAEEQAVKVRKKALAEGKATSNVTVAGTTLSVNDVAMVEGNSGDSRLVFTVQLSKVERSKVVSARYVTADITAKAGADYLAASGTVTFPKGSTSQTIAVAVIGNSVKQSNRTFSLKLSNPVNATLADDTGVGTIIDDDVPPSGVPVHNSLPGAASVIYLDMDGQVVSGTPWAGGATLRVGGIASTYTQAQMSEIWSRVAEDYAPFAVNVTTEESVYLAAASERRIRCLITPDSAWYGAVGGVAYVGSFTWPGDTPCWVFSDQLANTPRFIAEACSHEVGHTLGLSHDGRISPKESYYAGQGTGEVGWAPIMGVGYYKMLVQWSKGEYLSADNSQDDVAIITSQNGFGYRADDHADTSAGASMLTVIDHAASARGIIGTRDDVDVFSFTTVGGGVTFAVSGDATSQNLDVLAEIKDASGQVLASSNPDLLNDSNVTVTLPAGTYYLNVSGVGRGDYLVDGYTDYGSIGQYAITGTVP